MTGVGTMNRRAVRRVRHAAWLVDKRVRYGRYRVRTTEHPGYRDALAAAAVVSIDVFDTALFRFVPRPVDVFEIVGMRLREAGATVGSPIIFRELRVAAERNARRAAEMAGHEEVTLDEIYEKLAVLAPTIDVRRAAAEELAVERAVCVANPDIKSLYDRLQAEGRRIVFVSDTYLPATFVRDLLSDCGFGSEHRVFVSNAERATKERGTLLPLVARKLGIAARDLVHVGDNLHADVEAAQRGGVPAFWYVGRLAAANRSETLGERVLGRMAALARATPAANEEERVLRAGSHDVAGPIFLGLTQWLAERVRAQPADLVLFCARDGFFLNELYQRFAAYVDLPPARYFEVSRRALVFPSIVQLDKRALDVLSANNAPLELAEYFSRIGIDVAAYPAALAAVGLRPESRIYDADSRRRVRELFVALADVVVARAAEERDLMLAYLRESGVFDAHDIVLVDIGWGGTLQQALADVLVRDGRERRLRAYYLSTDERIRSLDPAAGPAEAWFANGAEPAWMQRDISPGYWLLEIAFAAQHGTVLGYRREPDGGVVATHHDYDPDAPNARASRAIHAASLALVERWLAIFGGPGPALDMRTTFARFQRFVQRPTDAEARFFGDMVHVGGLGTTTETLAIASPPPLREVLRRPRVLLDAYRESHWQLAFLQRVLRSNALARGVIALREAVRAVRAQLKGRVRAAAASSNVRS